MQKVTIYLAVALVASVIVLIMFRNQTVFVVGEWLLNQTERRVEIGEWDHHGSGEYQFDFVLPADRRAWALYIEDRPGIQNQGQVEVFFKNKSSSLVTFYRREIDGNEIERFEVKFGEEVLVYAGDVADFFKNLTRRSEHRYDEFVLLPFLGIRSLDGKEIMGEIRISSENEIRYESSIEWFAYLPRDTI